MSGLASRLSGHEHTIFGGRRAANGDTPNDDVGVTDYLLRVGRVAAVPGRAFGLSPYFRISTATSDDILSEAMARDRPAVKSLL